jgi:hypothetical protein
MGERQRQFREAYRAEISPRYNGAVHIGVIYIVGIAVIAWCADRLQGASWEWLLVVPVFVLSNLFDGGSTNTTCTGWWTCGRCARSTTAIRASTTSTSPTA